LLTNIESGFPSTLIRGRTAWGGKGTGKLMADDEIFVIDRPTIWNSIASPPRNQSE
jgi:hypothetical protein